MAIWRQYQLGARIRVGADGSEERLALDRSDQRTGGRQPGRPVTVRAYPGATVPASGGFTNVAPNVHIARPLELTFEPGEVVAVRELSFGPSLADVIAAGPQPEPVVGAALEQILDGLSAIHAGGRPHLRLSPEAIRFDLLSGAIKIGDLEEAALLPEPRHDLIPRFLEPDVRVGLGTPASDIFSIGRIGEALLRGGAPLGGWGTGSPASPLLAFLLKCQASVAEGRPADAAAALVALRALGISAPAGATLPLAKFVRSHAGALRELRRWRALPLPMVPPADGRSHRMILSSFEAKKLWGLVGAGAVSAVLLSAYLAGAPARGSEVGIRFPGDACTDDVHASIVASTEAAPKGFVVTELAVPPETAVAVDGCALAAMPPGEALLAVEPGPHDLRAVRGSDVAVVRIDAKVGKTQRVDLRERARPRGDQAAALAVLAKDLAKPAEVRLEEFDPIEVGMFDPIVRHLLVIDASEIEPDADLQGALPDTVGLALEGFRAAARQFSVAEMPCGAKLSAAVERELGPVKTDLDEDNLRRAVGVLTVTRIVGPQLRAPLRIESEALTELGVTPGRRLLAAVSVLAAQPDLATCLGDLEGAVHRIDTLATLILAQVPGAVGESEDAEDATE